MNWKSNRLYWRKIMSNFRFIQHHLVAIFRVLFSDIVFKLFIVLSHQWLSVYMWWNILVRITSCQSSYYNGGLTCETNILRCLCPAKDSVVSDTYALSKLQIFHKPWGCAKAFTETWCCAKASIISETWHSASVSVTLESRCYAKVSGFFWKR